MRREDAAPSTGPPRHPRYRLRRKLGSGGSSSVYLAHDLFEGSTPVVLKVCHQDLGPAHLVREFRLLRELRHPGIARALDFGSLPDGSAFFTMEYVTGVNLARGARALRRKAAQGQPEALLLAFLEMAEALAYLHRRGLLHLDIKPANAILADGHVRLIDFGLFHSVAQGADQVPRGTAFFAAPELTDGGPVDARTDLYALGVTMHWCFTGRYPIAGRTAGEVAHQHRHALPAPPEGVPEPVARLILKLLAKSPRHRFQLAEDVAAALRLELGPDVIASRAAPLAAEPGLAGRKRELEGFCSWYAGAEKGAGPPALLVRGAAGMGRSRLLDACATELLTSGARVIPLRSSGARDEQGLRDLVEKAAILEPLTAKERRDCGFVLTLCGLSSDRAHRQEIAGAGLEALRARTFEELRRLLARRAARPLVVLMDDVDRADPALQDFVRRLADGGEAGAARGDRLAILMTARGGGEAGSAGGFAAPQGARVIDLEPLSAADVLAILRDRDPAARPSQAQSFWSASGGHPGLLARLLRRGDRTAGAGVEPAPVALRTPEAELSGLGAAARRLLLYLLAFSGPARVADVSAVTGLHRKRFELARRELEAASLAAGTAETCYVDGGVESSLAGAFGGEELRAAYGDVGRHFWRREKRPALAARCLLEAGDVEMGLLACAAAVKRFKEAGRLEDAVELLGLAGSKARGAARRPLWEEAGDLEQKCGRFDAADALLAQALEAGPMPATDRLRLLRKRGGVLQRRGQSDEARALLGEALALAEKAKDVEEQMRVLLEVAALQLFCGDGSGAAALVNRGLELLESPAAARLDRAARASHGLSLRSLRGHILVRQLEYEPAAAELEKSLALASELGATSSVALLLNQLGVAYHQSNRLAAALRVYARAERLAMRLGDASALFSVLCNVAAIRGRLGDLETAGALLHRAGDLPAARRSDRARLYWLHTQGLLRKLLLDDARGIWEEAVKLAAAIPDPHFEGYGRLHLLENEIEQGRWAHARELLAAFAQPVEDARLRRSIEVRRAQLDALCGHREPARASLAGGEGDVLREDHASLWERVGLAAAWTELGELEPAAALLQDAGSRFRASGQGPGAIQCLLLGAEVALRQADAVLARRRLDEARRALKALEAPAGARGSAFILPYLEARAALLEGSLTVGRKLAEARQSLPPGGFLERSFLLELVAGASGERGATRRIRSARERFLSALAPEDARGYSRRDHLARLGLRPAGSPPPATLRSAAERRYEALLGLRHVRDYRQALSLILAAAGAQRGAILLDGEPGVAAAHGLAGRPAQAMQKLRDLALRSRAGVVGAGLGAEVRLPDGGRAGLLYVEPEAADDDADLQGFLDTAGLLLGSAFQHLLRRTREAPSLTPTPRGVASRTRTLAVSSVLESQSPRMRELLTLIERTRASSLPILLVGESGVGKDYIARWIHHVSPRRTHPFLAQDCSAIPAGLLEAEIFGHEEGAFTGARQARQGYIFAAEGGSFYLDNVDSLSLDVQAKLLRVLEGQPVRPLGAATAHKVDVRFIASSQDDLKLLCAQGSFRKDLYFRLSGITLEIPPLRERAEDIPMLVRTLQRQVRGSGSLLEIAPGAMEALKLHPWPGNVRELESVVRRLALTSDAIVDEEHVRRMLGAAGSPGTIPRWMFEGRSYEQALEDVKREYLLHVFDRCEGDMDRVAAELGTTRRNVYLRFAQAGLRPTDLRGERRGAQ